MVLLRPHVSRDGAWHRHCEAIRVNVPPSYFRIFVGRRLGSSSRPHTKGTVDVAMLSVVVLEDNGVQGWNDYMDE